MFKRYFPALIILLLITSGVTLLKFREIVSPVQKSEHLVNGWDADRSFRLPSDDLREAAESLPDDVETDQNQKEKRIDFEALKGINGSPLSWWIRLNKNHEPTTISPQVEKLIRKYNVIFQGDTKKKKIYLTFDEGYENGYTESILDTLRENEVKALFFITGLYLKTSPDLVKRMLKEGHAVGNHSLNHPSLPTLNNAQMENEILGLEKRFNSVTGKRFKYLRPPAGQYSEKVLAAADQLGYKTVFWSFAYEDFDINNQKGSQYAYDKVMDNLHPGAVILLHAVSKDNAEGLSRIIQGIKARGYDIMPFDL